MRVPKAPFIQSFFFYIVSELLFFLKNVGWLSEKDYLCNE